jgi:uncharacterized protein (TIGR03067 family)
MPYLLVALDGGPDIPTGREPIMVGRHPSCDVRLRSIRVSRRHCCLTEGDGAVIVRDLGSTNGTLVKGRRVEAGRLQLGDELSIAHVRYRLERGQADGASIADCRPGMRLVNASSIDPPGTGMFEGGVEVERPAMPNLPLVVLALGLPSLPMSSRRDMAKMDEQQVQGAWQAVKIVMGGRSVPTEVVTTLKYVFEGAKVSLWEGDKETGGGTFSLGPTREPKAIDVSLAEGPEKGKTVSGIYEVEGDRLRMCLGEERPAEFRGAGKAALVEPERERPKQA